MNANDVDFLGLQQLPTLSPDTARANRVVEKCQARLERRRRPAAPSRRLEFAIGGGFCALYLLAIVSFALEVSLGMG